MKRKDFEKYLNTFEIGIRYDDCVIYALCEPDTDIVRYIGQTCDFPTRIIAHLYEDKIIEKLEWIQSLIIKSQFPKVKILELIKKGTFNNFIRENHHIQNYLSQGFHLFNSSKPNLPKRLTCKHKYWSLEILSFVSVFKCVDCTETIKAIIIECDHVFSEILDDSKEFICIKCGVKQ